MLLGKLTNIFFLHFFENSVFNYPDKFDAVVGILYPNYPPPINRVERSTAEINYHHEINIPSLQICTNRCYLSDGASRKERATKISCFPCCSPFRNETPTYARPQTNNIWSVNLFPVYQASNDVHVNRSVRAVACLSLLSGRVNVSDDTRAFLSRESRSPRNFVSRVASSVVYNAIRVTVYMYEYSYRSRIVHN